MPFKFLCWLASKDTFLNDVFSLPICRVNNDVDTESYTLLCNGWVEIRSTSNNKVNNTMPVMFVSQKLVDKFNVEIKKLIKVSE